MSQETITFSRAALYEIVWSTPMQKLAKEFGLSDVGLAKLCRRHYIPLPGRGYWARIQVGQKPSRTPLPGLKEPRLDTIRISPSEQKGREEIVLIEEEVIPTITVAADRPINHPIACRIERGMSRKTIDARGLLATRKGRWVPLKLTAGALARALRILDALFTVLADANHTLEWLSPYNAPPKIVADGEKLQFMLTEAIERRGHKPTADEQARLKLDQWWRPPQWDYTPTGRLRLTLESCEYSGISHSWADKKRRNLDTCLGEVLIMCQKMATAIKKERDDRARHQRNLERQRARELEEQERQEEYLRKSVVIKKAAESLELSQDIRRLIVCLGSTNKIHELRHDCFGDFKKMLEWCTEYANSLDPTNRLSRIIEEFTSRRRRGW